MPTYVYECAKCGDEFELWQSFSDEPLKKHPSCGGKVTKVLQPVGIVLKGSGFYKNDSRTGSRSGGAKRESTSESSSSDTGSTAGSTGKETGSSSKKSEKPGASGSSSGDTKSATTAAKSS